MLKRFIICKITYVNRFSKIKQTIKINIQKKKTKEQIFEATPRLTFTLSQNVCLFLP